MKIRRMDTQTVETVSEVVGKSCPKQNTINLLNVYFWFCTAAICNFVEQNGQILKGPDSGNDGKSSREGVCPVKL